MIDPAPPLPRQTSPLAGFVYGGAISLALWGVIAAVVLTV